MSSTTSKTISYETAVDIVTSRIPPGYSRRHDADFDCLVELEEEENEDEEGAKENGEEYQIDDEPVMTQVTTHGSVLNDVLKQIELLNNAGQ
ncbi:unnamed protein product [Adineta ricciae]|uniref:Uncharacterized protein n=1 Tax=Adineta ricciae TaxID=249248 RepID=A0A816C195_ADIRI|nr:unnamed protein product [Adineta ricciae]